MSSLEPLCNFRRNPRSLEHLAAVVSAAVLCRQAAMMNPTNPPEKVQEIISIALPSAIEQKIGRFMPLVKKQITSWSNLYDMEIFFDKRAREYFQVLVWSADGTINDEETAREMLKQDDLDADEKYRIACIHCLQNEIKTLRSNLNTKMNLRKTDTFYPLVCYWEAVCGNDISATSTEFITQESSNIEYTSPVCAIDYFLDRLTLDERISVLQESYLQKTTFRSWENFLMKLSNEVLVSVLCDSETWKHVNIEHYRFDYLMKFWMHADFVVQIWMRIRDSYDDYEFSMLIEKLLKCEDSAFQSTDHISLAVEIFNLAPYELRKAAFDEYINEWWWDRDSNLADIRLDVVILSTVEPDCGRYKFWADNWIYLFEKYPADCFVQFMIECCGEEGSEEFKMKVMEMYSHEFILVASNYCFRLLKKMRFSKLDQFLNMFSSDPIRIMKTKQMILRNNLAKWAKDFGKGSVFPPPNQFVDFIEGSFESIRSAKEFKIEILSSPSFLKACYKVAGSDIFDWLKDAVWMCSCNDDDFKLYKIKFSRIGEDVAAWNWSVFKDPGWMSFLKWCSAKEDDEF
ncbi:uncharacterized protein LOC135845894 isoform X1 [Planococcus citri]|uniref:uncharacterized protein LOC135845894 isoform X1 n=1 Tax=Planococcus citri TaxID=170843 RepID=UPI0031F9A711